MAGRAVTAELHSPQLKRLRNVQCLGTERSGHASVDHVRHQLYVGQDLETNGRALLKVTTRPGIVYEQNLVNEAGYLRNQQGTANLAGVPSSSSTDACGMDGCSS